MEDLCGGREGSCDRHRPQMPSLLFREMNPGHPRRQTESLAGCSTKGSTPLSCLPRSLYMPPPPPVCLQRGHSLPGGGTFLFSIAPSRYQCLRAADGQVTGTSNNANIRTDLNRGQLQRSTARSPSPPKKNALSQIFPLRRDDRGTTTVTHFSYVSLVNPKAL